MAWASIETKDGWRYRLSDGDVLWAARMAAFEGGDAAKVLWTVTQRFAQPGFRWSSFTTFARSFSQPINPKWEEDGACCCGSGNCPAPGGPYCGRPECSESRLSRRRDARTITWAELERRFPAAVRVTRKWASAELDNPVPKSVDFAAPVVAKSFVDRNPGSRILSRAGNWFIGTASSLRRSADYTVMRLGSRVAGPASAVGATVALAGAAVLGYAMWRRLR